MILDSHFGSVSPEFLTFSLCPETHLMHLSAASQMKIRVIDSCLAIYEC
jgi:hypothetical protein